MRIACISDLHGHLPDDVPDCDILLIGGDIVPITHHEPEMAIPWMATALRRWVDRLAGRTEIIAVAGNHDFVFEVAPSAVPPLRWTYLQDSGAEVRGLKVWGSPWQPRFMDWAFNLDEPDLRDRWAMIPAGTDILLLHGPPYGYGDYSTYGRTHVGSPGLLERIEELKPRLVVAGHIHSGHGRYRIGDTIFVNASLADERYRPTNPIQVVDL